MPHPWIADRTLAFDSSGIRKVFDLAGKIKNPINLSIGQPDFDVPIAVQDAMVNAIRGGKNNYSVTQGIPELRQGLKEKRGIAGESERDLFICSGTSGGLNLALMSMINEGDEVIFFDPYFVMYPSLVRMAGGVPIPLDCGEGFQIDVGRVEQAITDKTKIQMFCQRMPTKYSLALRKTMDNNEPGIDMKQHIQCPHCMEESEVSMPLGANFFWPDA